MKKIKPRSVRRKASIIAKIGCSPAPMNIGIGPIISVKPDVPRAPKAMAATVKIIIPRKIRMKPSRKMLVKENLRGDIFSSAGFLCSIRL